MIPSRGKVFLFFTVFRPTLGSTQPFNQWVWKDLPGIKQPGFEADYSPPSSTKIKNGGAIPPLPERPSWHSAYLIKNIDSFIFTSLPCTLWI
jgi:hypothetical protein